MANRPFTLRLPDTVREDLKFLSALTNRSQASIASEEKWAELLGTENELPMPKPDIFSNQMPQ